jgi:hypothetical protein
MSPGPPHNRLNASTPAGYDSRNPALFRNREHAPVLGRAAATEYRDLAGKVRDYRACILDPEDVEERERSARVPAPALRSTQDAAIGTTTCLISRRKSQQHCEANLRGSPFYAKNSGRAGWPSRSKPERCGISTAFVQRTARWDPLLISLPQMKALSARRDGTGEPCGD